MSTEHHLIEPPPPPGTRARLRWWHHVMFLLALLVLVAVGAVAWTLYTLGGAQFVLGRIAGMAGEGIRYEGVEGSLGGTMRIKLIEVSRPDMYARVEDFEMDTALLRAIGGRLTIHQLKARLVEVRTASTGAAAQLPVDFSAPYELRLLEGRVGELRLGVLTKEANAERDPQRKRALMDKSRGTDLVVRDILLRGEGDKRYWKVDEARAGTEYGGGVVSGRVETHAPYTLEAKAQFEGVASGRPYKANVAAKGTLKNIEAAFEGEFAGDRGNGRLVFQPFERRPLRSIDLKAANFDLANIGAGLHTRLALDARLAARGDALAGTVRVDNAEPGAWDRKRLPFVFASGRVVITLERVEVSELEAAFVGGGRASGNARWQKGAGVQARLDVADVNLLALHGGLQKTLVAGRVTVEGDARSQRFDLALKDPRFDIDARAALAGNKLEVETVRVGTGGGSVVATGSFVTDGAREIRFEGRAEHFDPSAFAKTPKGDVNFTFATRGSFLPAISGEVKVDLAPSTFSGLAASGRVNIAGDAKRIAAADVDVTLGEGRLIAKGALGRTGDALEISLRAAEIGPLAKLAGIDLAGGVQAQANLAGTFAEPTLDAKVKATHFAIGTRARFEAVDATLSGNGPVHRLEINAELTREERVRVVFAGGFDPKAKAPAWNGKVESLALTGRGAFALTAPVTLAASAERVELGEASVRGDWGEVRIATVRWTPKTLDVVATTEGVRLQNLARSLRIDDVPRSNLVVAGDVAIHATDTMNASANLKRVSGDVRLGEPPVALGVSELTLKATVVNERATASVALAGDRIGRIRGEGAGRVVRRESGWGLSAGDPVEARVVFEETNLEQFAPWLGTDAKLGGKVNAQVTVSGTGAEPQYAGSLRAENVFVREPQGGFELEDGQLALRLAGHSLAIERLSASTPWRPSEGARARIPKLSAPQGGGKVSAEGTIDLAARTGSIRVKLDHVPVTQIATRFLSLSGEARLDALATGLGVTGTFKADAGWIGALAKPLPTVSDDVVVVRQAAKDETRKETIKLDLGVALGDQLYFQGRGLDTRLAGEIRLAGTPGAGMKATGSIRAVGGRYDAYGQQISIERGVLTFAGPIDNPQLNVLALRKGLPVEAGVEVLGTTTRPKVRLVSFPDVPEPEKLAWLVLGRGASDSHLGDSGMLLAAARALLGNTPGSDLTSKLGFEDIRIGRSDANSVLGVLPESTVAGRTGTSSAADVVSVGRRINDSMHVSYEQGLSDAEGALRFTWQISRQFQVLVRAGYLPGLDLVYRWTFK
jgi:translocation and assembly module TamB